MKITLDEFEQSIEDNAEKFKPLSDVETKEVEAIINGANGKSAFGCLHRFADSSKISGEEMAWTQADLEKYANN